MLERIKKIKFEYVRILIYIISIILSIYVLTEKLSLECFWLKNYGILCPACGCTRATSCILQLKIQEAYELNAFYTCVLFPYIFILIVNDIFIILKRKKTKVNNISLVEIMLGEAKNV